jgi:hypothetical protein
MGVLSENKIQSDQERFGELGEIKIIKAITGM